MIIYPIIELLQGKCVSLVRGVMEQPHYWHVDPVEKARSFVEQGAEWLQVTDLDAVSGKGSNAELISEIIRVAGVPVQVAGGVSSDERVKALMDVGAARVIIGTAAVKWPDWVKGLAKTYPDQIALAVDVFQGRVMVSGWTESSAFTPEDFIHAFTDVPLSAVILTDIDRDLDAPESSFALTTRIAEQTKTPVIVSGLVKTLDDVSTLKYMPNIAGAVIGRALFNKNVDLAEAIAIARPEPERIAQFQ